MIYPLVALTIALFVSLVTTPLVRKIAIRFGLVDKPDAHRKLHRGTIALCGGIAVLASLIVTVLLMIGVRDDIAKASASSRFLAAALTVASVAIVALGVIDDRVGLRGRQKLLGQILICVGLVVAGFQLPSFSILGWEVQLGSLAPFITIGWLLLAINSVNLIDGADGLCSSVGWIACAACSAIAYYTGNVVESMLAASMAGALLGFLVFNLPPAKVFLGDAGSMFVGLFLGVLTMRVTTTSGSALPIMVPIGILAIPLFDSAMAIVRRKLTGRSVFTVDRGHLHHNLMRIGIRNQLLVAAITGLSIVTTGSAVLTAITKSDWYAVAGIILALGLLIATKAFGFAELELLSKRAWGIGKSMARRPSQAADVARIQKVRLQGSREWEIVWKSLVNFAERNELARLSMDLNVPWIHEGFHADWHVHNPPEANERWHLKLPIESSGRIIGRLELTGRFDLTGAYDVFPEISQLLDEIRPCVDAIVNDTYHSATDPTPEVAVAV